MRQKVNLFVVIIISSILVSLADFVTVKYFSVGKQRPKMAMLQLCLGVVTFIQLTSSQSTYDVIQQENDVSRCGRTEQVLIQLVTSMSRMETAIYQLQSDAAKPKAGNQQQEVAGIPESK